MIIAGYGGHALEALSILKRIKSIRLNDLIFYVSSNKFLPNQSEYNVTASKNKILKHLEFDKSFIIATGTPKLRHLLFNELIELGGTPKSIISEKAEVSTIDVSMGTGLNVMDFSYIGPQTTIGDGVLINTLASVHHHSVIGNFSEISPGARVLGNSKVGYNTFIGANATLLPGIEVGNDCIIGAGAVVTKNLASGSKVMGIPAK